MTRKRTTSTEEASPAPKPTPKKISANDFVLNLLCDKPDSSVEDIQKALQKANLKLNEWTVKAWKRDMKKIFIRLEELGKLKS